jgi:hypothetical protein
MTQSLRWRPARPSAPCDCSAAAVAASRDAVLASSAAAAIWRAPLAVLRDRVQDRFRPCDDLSARFAEPFHVERNLLQRHANEAIVLYLDSVEATIWSSSRCRIAIWSRMPRHGVLRTLDVLRCFARKAADVVRHDRESTSGVAGSRRFRPRRSRQACSSGR